MTEVTSVRSQDDDTVVIGAETDDDAFDRTDDYGEVGRA